MAKLVDLARTKAEKKKEADRWSEPSVEDQPDYGYGLTLHLTDAEITKLGLEGLETDDMVNIVGVAMVTSSSSNKVAGTVKREASLQIQKMSVDADKDETTAGEALYGEG